MISKVRIGLVYVLMLGGAGVQAATALSLGSSYAGTITVPGETNAFTFTGSAGQRLFFDSLDADAIVLNATLYSPGGDNLYQANDDYDAGPWLLTETGTYTLVIAANPNSPVTGNFAFRLLDLSAAPTLTLGSTVSGQLSPPLACNVYQFNATHGQRFSFQLGSYSTNHFTWQLVSPANAVLAQGQWYNQISAPITLPIDGAYALLIQGNYPGATPLLFRLQASLAMDTAVASSGFGAPHAGTIGANQTNSFTYTGSAGLPVYFNSLDTSGQSLVVDLMDPTGNAVFSIGETGDAGPVVLPRSGTYTLNVRGAGGASGNFNFRLLDLSATPVLTLNTSVSNSLALAHQTDVYQFSGSAGQRLYYDSLLNSSAGVQVRLLAPNGVSPIGTSLYYDQGPLALPASGTYYFFVQNAASAGSTYQFNLLDIAAQPALPLNTDLTGTLPPYVSRLYQLSGSTGEQLYFNGKGNSSGGAYWTLYDSRNNVVSGASSGVAGDFEVALPYSGNYVLVFSAAGSSVDYSNQVRVFNYSTNALTLGTVVTNNILNAGDQLVYTFNGTAGQRIYYDALNPAYLPIYAALVAPSGQQLDFQNASSDSGPMTLPQTGAYTLVFNGSSDTTGGIAFSLLDVAAQPLLQLNQDFTGTLPANSSLVYRVDASAGQKLYFNAKGGAVGGAYWTLSDPWNNSVPYGSANLGQDFEPPLYYSGEYVLVLTAGSNPAFYSNQVNTFTYTTNTIGLGTVVSNNLINPGDQLYYTFNANAGQRIYLDALVATYQSIDFLLLSPSGQQVASGNTSYDYSTRLIELPQTGAYLLQIDGNGDSTGPVSFQLLDIDAQPTLPLNTDLVGNLAPNLSLAYKLTGSAGQHLYFNAKGVIGGGAYWSLYGPNNATVAGNSLQGDFEQILPYSGNYAVVLQGGANAVSYSNQVNTFAYTTNALTLGTSLISTVANPGDQLYYAFTGTAGQRIYYDSRQTNYVAAQVGLVSPSGANVFYGGVGSDFGPYTLSQNGTYTLIVDGSANATGAVSFNLLDLAAATPVTLGTTINDALVDQTQTRLYKFSGTAGQRVNLQSLSASGSQAFWALYTPADQLIGTEPYITGNIGFVTLPMTGTYTLAVIGYGANPLPVTYQLSLIDVSDSTVASSGFGTVNSGTISANQTNSFNYSASAGTPVFFDSQDTSGVNLVVDLTAPDGTVVFSLGEVSDTYGPYILPRSGNYTLNVRGNGASGNYRFRLLDLSSSTQLPLNTPVSGTLNNPYETDVYRFISTPGQVLIYDALTNDVNYPSVFANLVDPKGQNIGPGGADFQNDRGPFVVQYGGTCYFFVRNNQATASTYAFQLLDVAAQPNLPVNTSVTNIQAVFGQTVYRYSGTAGQQLYFAGQPSNPSGAWQLFDPNMAIVSGGSGSMTGDLEVTLPYTGTYALTFYSYASSPATEVFLVNDFNYLTNTYTIGTTVVDVIHRSGERHFYTFTGTLGQTLIYDALTNDPAGPGHIYANLYNPQGLPEGPISGTLFSYDRGPFTLQQSGTYTLAIDGSGEQTGTYAFRLLDVSAQPALPINAAVTNTLGAYPLIVYRYSGTAGQQLYFHGDVNNLSGGWVLYDPNNNQLVSSSLTGDFELKLPLTGQYSLVFNNYTTSSGPEIFQVNDYQYFTNAYTLGTPVVDAINRPGEQHYYSFTGKVGQRLIYNALTNDPASPNSINVSLLNPQGVAEGPLGGRFSFNRSPFTLQQSGTYTLVVDGQSASVGTFAFQLLDVASLPNLPMTAPVTNTLAVFQQEIYQYSGLPGQHLYFHSLGSNPSGTWYFYDPNNNSIVGAGLGGDFELTLQTPGTYVLIISSAAAAPATEIFQVTPFNFGENPVFNQAPVLTHIPDQVFPSEVVVTFTAQASDPNNDALTFSLDPGSPAGASINPTTGAFSWNPPVTGLSSVTPVTVRVADNGTPSLSAAQTLNIEVIAGPMMISAQPSNGVVNVSWHSAPGKHYRLLYKNEIYDPTWQAVGSDVTAAALVTIQVDNGIGARTYRFYRIQALDPLTP